MKLPPLRTDSATPIYRQLYDYVRAAILSGQIAPGTNCHRAYILEDDYDSEYRFTGIHWHRCKAWIRIMS